MACLDFYWFGVRSLRPPPPCLSSFPQTFLHRRFLFVYIHPNAIPHIQSAASNSIVYSHPSRHTDNQPHKPPIQFQFTRKKCWSSVNALLLFQNMCFSSFAIIYRRFSFFFSFCRFACFSLLCISFFLILLLSLTCLTL